SRINATVNLPSAARLARVDTRGLAGQLEGTIDIAGSLAAPNISLTVTSRETSYPPIGSFRLSSRSSLSGSRANIETLDVQSTTGSLHAEGRIELDAASPVATPPVSPPKRGGGGPSKLALRWSDLRVDDLVQAIGYRLPIRSGSLGNGFARINFDARDRTMSRLRLSATTTLDPVPDAPNASLALSGKVD